MNRRFIALVDSSFLKYKAHHMSTYYFVAFESRSKPDALVKTVSNVILKDVHPVISLANPPDAYMEYWVGYLLFWSEISEDVAMEGAKYTPIEGRMKRSVFAKAWQKPLI